MQCGEAIPGQAHEDEVYEGPSSTTLVVGALILSVLLIVGLIVMQNRRGGARAESLSTGANGTDVVCVDPGDKAQIDELERTGWKKSTGGFVADDARGKKCFTKQRSLR
jgi:hypothetical protein